MMETENEGIRDRDKTLIIERQKMKRNEYEWNERGRVDTKEDNREYSLR